MPDPSTREACAELAAFAARLHRCRISYHTARGEDWFVFLARVGNPPPEELRALCPGVRPGLAPPTDEELRLLACLAGGPRTGPELAKLLDLEVTGGAFSKRLASIQARGYVHNPEKGYRLTEYGQWALEATGKG